MSADEILDLTIPESLKTVGLADVDLTGEHSRCQLVGAAAHQLGLHGVLAPAATQLGETLALFTRHLPEAEVPKVIETILWEALPADPRRFRIVKGTAAEN